MLHFILIISFLSFIQTSNAQQINQWVALDSGSSYYYSGYPFRRENISCLDKNRLIVIDQDVMNTKHFLKYSENRGDSWIRLLDGGTFKYNFLDLDYADENTIYVVGDTIKRLLTDENYNTYFKNWGVIFSSFDKGETWNKLQLDSNTIVTQVDMLDAYTGIANQHEVDNYYYRHTQEADTILYTTDGFETYEKITTYRKAFVEDIDLISENIIYLEIIYYENGLKTYEHIISYDKGKTWQHFDDGNTVSIHFIDENIAYKTVFRESEENEDIYYTDVYKTINGGKSWEYSFTPESIDHEDYWINFITAFDENNVIVSGRNGLLYRTTDGGENWFQEYPANNISGGLDMRNRELIYPAFPSEDVAFLVADRRLLRMENDKILTKPFLYPVYKEAKPKDVEVRWSEVDGAKQYQYQIAISNDHYYSYEKFNNPLIDTIISDTILKLPELEYDTWYYGRVKAIGEGIESEWYIRAPHIRTLKDAYTVNPPSFIKPKTGETIAGNPIIFEWQSLQYIEWYDLQISDNIYFSGDLFFDESLKASSITLDNFEYGEEYFARVCVNDIVKSKWFTISFKVEEETGVVRVKKIEKFIISPNPASDYIEISFSNKGLQPFANSGEIEIYDVLGNVVINSLASKSTSVPSGHLRRRRTIRADISNLPRGVYFVRIGARVEKFVKR